LKYLSNNSAIFLPKARKSENYSKKTWKTERKSEKNPLEFEFISVVKQVFIN
jgi:hypothetical protein